MNWILTYTIFLLEQTRFNNQIIQHQSEAISRILSTEEKWKKFQDILKRFETICPACYLLHGKTQSSPMYTRPAFVGLKATSGCHMFMGRCLRCFKNHFVKDCSVPLPSSSKNANGLCYACFIPSNLGTVKTHTGQLSKGCQLVGGALPATFPWIVMLVQNRFPLLFHPNGPITQEFCSDDKKYFEWLNKRNADGFSNLMELVLLWFEHYLKN